MAWMQLEDWDSVRPWPDEVQKALEMLELNIPTAHREAARSCHLDVPASGDIQDLTNQLQQLQRKEEDLEHCLAMAECMLWGLALWAMTSCASRPARSV